MKKILILLLASSLFCSIFGQSWQRMPANYFLFPKYIKVTDSLRATSMIYGNDLNISNRGTFLTDLISPVIYGGTGSGGNITIYSTSHGTKGLIKFGTSAYDEVNNRLGIGKTNPSYSIDASGAVNAGTGTSNGFRINTNSILYQDGSNFTLNFPGGGYGRVIVNSAVVQYWKAGGDIGFGNSAPTSRNHLSGGAAGVNTQWNNTASGELVSDGLHVGIDASANGYINQKENLPLSFYTNNTEALRITSSQLLEYKYNKNLYFKQTLGTDTDGDWLINLSTGINFKQRSGGSYNNMIIYSGRRLLLTNSISGSYFVGNSIANETFTGVGNIGLGIAAMTGLTDGTYNIGIGLNALNVVTGDYNTAIGIGALGGSLGESSGDCTITGDYNTAIGYKAGKFLDAGSSNNTIIGGMAGIGDKNLSSDIDGSVFIGHYAGAFETRSNRFYINNQSRTNLAGDTTKSIIYGTFNSVDTLQELDVNAALWHGGSYGEMSLHDASTAISVTNGDSYTRLVDIYTSKQEKRITANISSGYITVSREGDYRISFVCSAFPGSGNLTWRIAAFKNGSELDNIHNENKLINTNDNQTFTINGFVFKANAGDAFDIRIRHSGGSPADFTPVYANFNVEYIGE